ncbi:MAG: HAD-IIA family hydrolase [Anaerolineales bacterium]|jgi:4-nitrophenyl phosphatase
MQTPSGPEAAPSLARLRALIVDMDGVLWHGSAANPGMAEFFRFLRDRDIRLVLATNNPTLTPASYRQKLQGLGAQVSEEEILTSAQATALYLARTATPGAKIFVIGEEGIRSALAAGGFRIADLEDLDADYVVCGMDRALTWEKLAGGTLNIRRGAGFIGTNNDATFPTERGITLGNGAVLAALATGSGRQPTIIGKPEPLMYQLAIERLGVPAGQTAGLGDRLETDILGAHRAGIASILVLSGVTTAVQLRDSAIRPTWVFAGLPELVQEWSAQLGSG